MSGLSSKKAGALAAAARSLLTFLRYNAKLSFAGKFIYFLLAAVAVFFLIIFIHTISEETPPSAQTVFYFLLVPATLLIFYPSAYSIQGDIDSRMLETLFGIPDYRYKVWLVRNLVQYLVMLGLLMVLALFSRVALADFDLTAMIFHLLFPVVFLGSAAFMLSTITRSGNATAAIMVVLLLFFWIAQEPLETSRWNLFHNPFSPQEELDVLLWARTTLYNRIYILVGSMLATMYGLLRLQKREKFI
ncbi:MAG: hypothetical protein KAT58_07895 [candidate division Zixibacteria bacterium]|nr:hypothetical protein [candidate division Zixibacteria bacterium]